MTAAFAPYNPLELVLGGICFLLLGVNVLKAALAAAATLTTGSIILLQPPKCFLYFYVVKISFFVIIAY